MLHRKQLRVMRYNAKLCVLDDFPEANIESEKEHDVLDRLLQSFLVVQSKSQPSFQPQQYICNVFFAFERTSMIQ